MAPEPYAERAQTAQSEIGFIARGTEAQRAMGVDQPVLMSCVGGDRAHHDVGMAADVFRHCLHREIDAMAKRIEIERRRPGVVEDHGRAALVRDSRNGRDVLYLEGERTGAFQEYR